MHSNKEVTIISIIKSNNYGYVWKIEIENENDFCSFLCLKYFINNNKNRN